jgi:outer membrane receptor protein involved in Fe transport
MFFFLMGEDSLSVDSVTVDSLIADSLLVYEIPEIIDFPMCNTTTPYTNACMPKSNVFTGYEQSLIDYFSITPFMLHIYGIGQLSTIAQRGENPEHTAFFLNGHRLSNPLFGYFNTVVLPVQFFESISTGEDIMTSSSQSINLVSKINQYDKPFSYVNYTFGSFKNSMYNIDFTRPITNDIGFYLSGLYRNFEGYNGNDDFQIASFYTNLYNNQILPMRCDIIYFSNDYGILHSPVDTLFGRGKDTFFDASFVAGLNNHSITAYYTMNENDYSEPYAHISLVKNYGIHTRSNHTIHDFIVQYGCMAEKNMIDSDLFGSHRINGFVLWVQLEKSFKRLFLTVASRGEWISNYDVMYLPKIVCGVDVYDSTYVTGTVSRHFRAPSIVETYESNVISYPYYSVQGNKDLLPEYYWVQELGIRKKNIFVINCYKYDFTDRIVAQLDNEGFSTYQNINSWQTIGVEGYLEVPFYVRHGNGNSLTEISAGYSGNYLFKGDSSSLVPKGISNLYLTLKRLTDRFSFIVLVKERFIGMRHDMSGQDLDPFGLFSIVGTIKFISLSCTLTIDNILDESYDYVPNYPMPPRSFALSIKWEFWN